MKILLTPKNNRGAVLIISIIIGVVALAAGLTAANFVSRSTRNITDQESSIKALAISESGVEKVLGATDVATYSTSCGKTEGTDLSESFIPSVGNNIIGGSTVATSAPCFFQEDINADGINDQSYYLEVTSKGGASTYTADSLAKDTVLEINTEGLNGKNITISWKEADQSVAVADKKYSSILITEVYDPSAYKVKKYAYNPDAGHLNGGQTSNGFLSATAESVSINLSTGTKIIRIKPLYFNATDIVVTVTDGSTFSTVDQGFDIYSTGSTCANVLDASSRLNSSVRKVKVTKTREHLPAIFDYVLYSGSESVPLTK